MQRERSYGGELPCSGAFTVRAAPPFVEKWTALVRNDALMAKPGGRH